MTMRAHLLGFILASLLLAGTGRAQEAKPSVVAVFRIENRGSPLTDQELVSLTDYLGTRLGERGQYRIIPRDEIRARLTAEKKKSFKECVDQSCQIEIGRELAAEFTVSSTIGRVGKLCLITASIYDLRKAATAKTATAKGPCQVEDLVNAIEEVADKLQGERIAQKPRPERGPEPTKTPTYTPPPPVTYQKVPEGPMLPGAFTDMHLTFSYLVSAGGNLIDPETLQFGLDASLDFRLGSLFTLGPFLRIAFTDYFIAEASIRAGILIEITRKFFLHPYVLGGFTYETVGLDTNEEYYWDLVGFHVRGGLGIKWMFSRDFGFCMDILAGFSSGVAIESEVEGDDGQAVEVAFNFGLVVGW
jgi:hypothetical protein